MNLGLIGFLLLMWVLIVVGGGIAVMILGPFTVSGFGKLGLFVASVIKAIVALSLVVLWIMILLKLKNWIFKKELRP